MPGFPTVRCAPAIGSFANFVSHINTHTHIYIHIYIECRVQGIGCRVSDAGCRVGSVGCRVGVGELGQGDPDNHQQPEVNYLPRFSPQLIFLEE